MQEEGDPLAATTPEELEIGLAVRHITGLTAGLVTLDHSHLFRWGQQLSEIFSAGGRLLVAGNGGSAAQAQHLTAELVGRFEQVRKPLPALALHTDTSAVTAIGNDFGFDEIFARQVRAHGRPNDVLIIFSTSGQSLNVLRAAHSAKETGIMTWALTGPVPNPLWKICDDYIAVKSDSVANVQECHMVATHLICTALDAALTGEKKGKSAHACRDSFVTATSAQPSLKHSRPPLNLVVIGDVLLDKDISGSVERVSPEAPVQVVDSLQSTARCGGAGLTACLAIERGHSVTLITALSSDENAAVARNLLAVAGVTIIDLGTTSATAVKTRIRASGQTLLMLDYATPARPPEALTILGRNAIIGADAIVISDYGRGLAAANDVRAVLTEVIGKIPIVWDPHPAGPAPISGITLVSPNSNEARRFAPGQDQAGLSGDADRARALRKAWGVCNVVVTRGTGGAVLVSDDDSPPLVIPAVEVTVEDTCGAGDLFALTAAALLGSGALPSQAVTAAVSAATAFVTSSSRCMELKDSRENALAVASRVRSAGGTVVATGGCFDLLHRGHVSMLENARRLGDCLIVCLNGDASVTRLKGRGRPLATVDDREAVLRALACVDAVIVFDEDTPAEILADLHPDIWVKGNDYSVSDLPERPIVENGGGRVVLVPYLDGRSSTSLIERVAGQYSNMARPM
jgi:D-beta-D-heptose 7-phosphate kinase / D-beta-D-heptose 1-phosphate adenosyltransferase